MTNATVKAAPGYFMPNKVLELRDNPPNADNIYVIIRDKGVSVGGDSIRVDKSELAAALRKAGCVAKDFESASLLEEVLALPVGTKFKVVGDGNEYPHPYIRASKTEAVYLNPELGKAAVSLIASNFAQRDGHIEIVKD